MAKGKRGKAESMTGAKANSVEKRTPSQTDMDLPKPDDIVFHMKTIKGFKDMQTSAGGRVRAARLAAKKCNSLLPGLIDELIGLERLTDKGEFKRRLEALGVGLKTVGAPIQLSVFDTLAGDVNKQAYDRGKAEADAGKGCNCPYPEGTDLADSYNTGWRNATGGKLGLTEAQTAAATANSGIGHNSIGG